MGWFLWIMGMQSIYVWTRDRVVRMFIFLKLLVESHHGRCGRRGYTVDRDSSARHHFMLENHTRSWPKYCEWYRIGRAFRKTSRVWVTGLKIDYAKSCAVFLKLKQRSLQYKTRVCSVSEHMCVYVCVFVCLVWYKWYNVINSH